MGKFASRNSKATGSLPSLTNHIHSPFSYLDPVDAQLELGAAVWQRGCALLEHLGVGGEAALLGRQPRLKLADLVRAVRGLSKRLGPRLRELIHAAKCSPDIVCNRNAYGRNNGQKAYGRNASALFPFR